MMGGINRGRVSVDPNGKWWLYTRAIPPGSRAIGTVTRDREVGALVRMPIGLLVQVNTGCSRSLDQDKVEAALLAADNADLTPNR